MIGYSPRQSTSSSAVVANDVGGTLNPAAVAAFICSRLLIANSALRPLAPTTIHLVTGFTRLHGHSDASSSGN
jgi:hypothetical protein